MQPCPDKFCEQGNNLKKINEDKSEGLIHSCTLFLFVINFSFIYSIIYKVVLLTHLSHLLKHLFLSVTYFFQNIIAGRNLFTGRRDIYFIDRTYRMWLQNGMQTQTGQSPFSY